LSEELDLKVALIFSWNPTICTISGDRFAQAKKELESIDVSILMELNNEDLLTIDIQKAIIELWLPLKRATSLSDLTQGVSVTKFLHFSFPHIFPMIDSNTMKKLGGRSVNLKWYSTFLSEWKNIYSHNKTPFDIISKSVNMPIARVIDIMLFTPQ
jgi:hypothetical protein